MTESCSQISTEYVFYTQSLTENPTQTQGKINGFHTHTHTHTHTYTHTHTQVLLHSRKAVGNYILQLLDMLGFEGNKTQEKSYFYKYCMRNISSVWVVRKQMMQDVHVKLNPELPWQKHHSKWGRIFSPENWTEI
jgi:hypothetical protein